MHWKAKKNLEQKVHSTIDWLVGWLAFNGALSLLLRDTHYNSNNSQSLENKRLANCVPFIGYTAKECLVLNTYCWPLMTADNYMLWVLTVSYKNILNVQHGMQHYMILISHNINQSSTTHQY